MNSEFSIPVRVYIEDTDAGGIVYYVNYLKYMERSRTELFRSLGFPKPAIITNDKIIVVASASVKYKVSAVLDDVLKVATVVDTLARSWVLMKQTVSRQDGDKITCLASGEIKLACVNRETRRPCALPSPVVNALKEHIREQNI